MRTLLKAFLALVFLPFAATAAQPSYKDFGPQFPNMVPGTPIYFGPTNNLIVVDSVGGNDTTGARGAIGLPFLTISQAKTIEQPGDVMLIRPGVYNVAGTWRPTNMTLIAYGATISGSVAGAGPGFLAPGGTLTLFGGCYSNRNTGGVNMVVTGMTNSLIARDATVFGSTDCLNGTCPENFLIDWRGGEIGSWWDGGTLSSPGATNVLLYLNGVTCRTYFNAAVSTTGKPINISTGIKAKIIGCKIVVDNGITNYVASAGINVSAGGTLDLGPCVFDLGTNACPKVNNSGTCHINGHFMDDSEVIGTVTYSGNDYGKSTLNINNENVTNFFTQITNANPLATDANGKLIAGSAGSSLPATNTVIAYDNASRSNVLQFLSGNMVEVTNALGAVKMGSGSVVVSGTNGQPGSFALADPSTNLFLSFGWQTAPWFPSGAAFYGSNWISGFMFWVSTNFDFYLPTTLNARTNVGVLDSDATLLTINTRYTNNVAPAGGRRMRLDADVSLNADATHAAIIGLFIDTGGGVSWNLLRTNSDAATVAGQVIRSMSAYIGPGWSYCFTNISPAGITAAPAVAYSVRTYQ